MPQLTTSNSSLPVSYPLYLDLSSIKSVKPYSLPFHDHCLKQNTLNFNLFYENILNNNSSFYSLHPQVLADSFNYYLGHGYQNSDRSVTSKSFSIESILSSPSKSDLGTDDANSPKQVSPSTSIGTQQCKLPSSSMFPSPTTSVGNKEIAGRDRHDQLCKDYFMKEPKCPNSNYGEQLNLGKTNLERICPGVSKKSNRISKQVSKMALSSTTGSKSKRVRTIFTPEQLERLETEFERQQYMVGTGRLYLASTLNLTEAQVKVWFQNRRIKWRKQHLEGQPDKSSQESKDL